MGRHSLGLGQGFFYHDPSYEAETGLTAEVKAALRNLLATKRANKELVRVVSMVFLGEKQDKDAVESWPAQWQQALEIMDAPQATRARLIGINDGMLELFESREDQDETLRTLNNGLL